MWKTILSYLPDWVIIMQAFLTFLVPYGISKVFHWMRAPEGE
ncbi:hypothetical protein [Bacillus sp. WMMC1349]|nr:hypothetical protein [Bacillus sp. WMMC1349]